ncbi:heat shock protein beta-7-like [Pristis pectinata]|uniref:heat shock protein beta-7-like n=1 Tax=Pristis pectinata TaxID=685728 RepID=UPI00223DFFC4|nr:heat shock protein beta-7-like [Pristis pectinata]
MSSLSSSSTFRSKRYSNYSRRSSGDPCFDQYIDAARNLFEEEMEKSSFRNGHFVRPRNESFGYTGRQDFLVFYETALSAKQTEGELKFKKALRTLSSAPVSGRPGSLGNVRTIGDTYQVTADVSQFDPEEIIVTMYNYHIVIKAEKVQVDEDGTIINTFTHKCQLPEDMDPLSVSCSRTDVGILTINVRRNPLKQAESPQPVYRSEVQL